MDDIQAGVKSTALLFGKDTKVWLSGFAAAATGAWLVAGLGANLATPYTLSVLAAASHLAWQIHSTNLDDRKDCMQTFVSNKYIGGLLMAGIVLGKVNSYQL